MEESKLIIWIMQKSAEIGGTLIIASLTTIITLVISGLVRKNKKINNSITKDDLNNGIKEAKDYSDVKLKAHEDNQIIEIDNMKDQIKETHGMVKFLYENAITNGK